MTEYWVSQAKHYCKYCNCWVADNKASIQFHENSNKHKFKLTEFNQNKRNQQLHGARSEQELKKQLQDIERAARNAVADDRNTQPGYFYSNANVQQRRPPPPPSSSSSSTIASNTQNSSSWQSSSSSRAMFGNAADEIPQEEEGGIETDKSGIYEVRGQKYLDGKIHADKIVRGARCEIFIEALDEWIPVTIIRRMDTAIPHTNLTLKTFVVTYKIPKGQPNAGSTVLLDGVKGEALRMLADDIGRIQLDDGGVLDVTTSLPESNSATGTNDEPSKPLVPAIVETTGLGGWQTVSVNVYDEEAVEREREKLAEQAAKEECEAQTASRKRKVAEEYALAKEDSGDVLGSYDPYQTNVYKGVFIGGRDIADELFVEPVSKGQIVQFKKRKPKVTSSTESSSVNRINSADEEQAKQESLEPQLKQVPEIVTIPEIIDQSPIIASTDVAECKEAEPADFGKRTVAATTAPIKFQGMTFKKKV